MKIRNVQLLRAIAALMVVASHLVPMERKCVPGGARYMSWIEPIGFSGVDLFFVISGFVIITSTWSSFGRPGIATNFLLRRAARIFPAYWIVLTPIFLVSLVLPHFVNSTQSVRPNVVASYLLLPQAGLPLLTVSWSLVYEMYFYYVYTLAIRSPVARLPLVIGAWMAFTLAVSLTFQKGHGALLAELGNTITFEFAFGMIVGWWFVKQRAFVASTPAIAFGVFAIALNGLLSETRDEPGHGSFRFLAIGLPMAAILYGFIGLELRQRFTASGPAVVLGNASYSLYLWHVPVLEILTLLSKRRAFLHVPFVHAAWLVTSVAVVIAVSIFAYRTIEEPLVRYFGGFLRLTSPGTILPNVPAA